MADPREGIAADGTIRTGLDRRLVPAAFEPALAEAAAIAKEHGATLYLYGSVANGTARPGSSDLDLLSVGLPSAAAVAERLSARYVGLCRGVEIASASATDLDGDTDAAYGFRVFLRHYCLHLTGFDPAASLPSFRADVRAARGFNGDIAAHYRRWGQTLDSRTSPAEVLGVRVARKTLLAVAGLVSVRDHTWTTDRARAAQRWGELEPELADGLRLLLRWATLMDQTSNDDLQSVLSDDGVVSAIVGSFACEVGLWADGP